MLLHRALHWKEIEQFCTAVCDIDCMDTPDEEIL